MFGRNTISLLFVHGKHNLLQVISKKCIYFISLLNIATWWLVEPYNADKSNRILESINICSPKTWSESILTWTHKTKAFSEDKKLLKEPRNIHICFWGAYSSRRQGERALGKVLVWQEAGLTNLIETANKINLLPRLTEDCFSSKIVMHTCAKHFCCCLPWVNHFCYLVR